LQPDGEKEEKPAVEKLTGKQRWGKFKESFGARKQARQNLDAKKQNEK
jgi:hypothetical protein